MDITKVTDNLFRGKRPSESDIGVLRDRNIKFILDLDDEKEHRPGEEIVCMESGIRYCSYPLNEIKRPSINQLKTAVSIICAQKCSIFVHCKHGHDRTGYVIAAYRIIEQGWTFGQAYKECIQQGHKWWFYPLWTLSLMTLAREQARGN